MRLMAGRARAVALACGLLAAAQAFALTDDEHVLVTARGDTLIGIGRRLLAEPGRWPELARLNGLRHANRLSTGMKLRIPLALMVVVPAPAELVSTVGSVQRPSTLDEGSVLRTGADGYAVVRLIDGTLLRLRPSSVLTLTESRRVQHAPGVRAGARVEQGRVEVEAEKPAAGRPGFRIGTPQGVLAVRGTYFRVATDATRTLGEVLEGTVAVSSAGSASPGGAAGGATGTAEQRVEAGFGTVVEAGRVAPPVPLLPAPGLEQVPRRYERPLLRIALPAVPGAAAYRAQISRNANFDSVLLELESQGPELRVAGLDDGDYVLRVRAVDALGLQGREAQGAITLKARPEPPLPSAPAPRARLFGSKVEFVWAANAMATGYQLQLASEPTFTAPLHDVKDLELPRATLDGLAPGNYHWRLRSARPGGDLGPWGDANGFELRPPPPAPAPPVVGDRGVRFAWPGLPGQRFDFEVARDEAFTQLVMTRQLSQAEIELPLTSPGRYWVRLRAIDPDGFVGPFGARQFFDIVNCLRVGDGGCARANHEPVVLTQ